MMGPARQGGCFGCKMEGGPLSSKALAGLILQAVSYYSTGKGIPSCDETQPSTLNSVFCTLPLACSSSRVLHMAASRVHGGCAGLRAGGSHLGLASGAPCRCAGPPSSRYRTIDFRQATHECVGSSCSFDGLNHLFPGNWLRALPYLCELSVLVYSSSSRFLYPGSPGCSYIRFESSGHTPFPLEVDLV